LHGITKGEAPVARPVVGHDAADLDVVTVEPGSCTLPETRTRVTPLVGEDLAVGETRMIVDRRVDEGVADFALPVITVFPPSVRTPPSTGRDTTQFLDVDVDELTWRLPFVATDDPSGRSVHPGEPIEIEPD
jgi:hypothetical protein